LDILRKWMQEFMDVGTKKKNDSSGSLVQLVKQEGRRGGKKPTAAAADQEERKHIDGRGSNMAAKSDLEKTEFRES
jgi:hypothetical protein